MAFTTPVGFRVLSLSVVQLSLAAVLKCGQSFRWTSYPLPSSPSPESPTHEYRLCLRDRIVCLRQSPDYLFYRSVFPEEQLSPAQEELRDEETLAWLKDYFQLDVNLVKLYDQWSERDPVFDKLKSRFSGIRILRQDPWETLVSCVACFSTGSEA
jgi:N-glycosylase/DNA lyase